MNQIQQSFFGENGLVCTGDLTEYGKMVLDKGKHFFVRHRIVMHIFPDDIRCDIASGTGLGHHDLQTVRGGIGNIFL